MKKIAGWIIKGRGFVFAFWAVFLAVGILFLPKVGINYNLSDYLPSDTGTKHGLTIMEDEFGLTGNLQVTLSGLDAAEAKGVSKRLSEIENVSAVLFDAENESYFQNGTARYQILIAGDDYSDAAAGVIADIRAALSEEDPSLSGAAVGVQTQKEALTEQMVYLLVVCVVMAYLILIFTTRSFLEPLLFLFTAGIAVVINLGTNAHFGEISYITNSVAAILQLALAMDYSIMLLHSFHRIRREEPDDKKAMAAAIADCIKPVSASALTTLAGLLALLFMSFTIGFDIGMVLMKGIVISALVSVTLFPAVVLLFGSVLDKAKFRSGKKSVASSGKIHPLARFGKKGRFIVTPVALLLVIAAGFVQAGNLYTFSDNSGDADKSDSSTLVLLYPKSGDAAAKQAAFYERLSGFSQDGRPILFDYSDYHNTVLEAYDAERLAEKTGLTSERAEELLILCHLYGSPALYSMTPEAFLAEADALVREDETVGALLGEEERDAVAQLFSLYTLLQKEYTAEALGTLLNTYLPADSALDPFYLEQVYGMYHYDRVENPKVDFRTMLAFLLTEAEENPLIGELVPSDQLTLLRLFSLMLNSFMTQAETPCDAAAFVQALNLAGASLTEEEAEALFGEIGAEGGELPYLPTAHRAAEAGLVRGEAAEAIEKDYAVYQEAAAAYGYREFLPAALSIVNGLLGAEIEADIPEEAVWQLYILYFYDSGALTKTMTAKGGAILAFVLDFADSELLPEGLLTDELLGAMNDLTALYAFFSDETALTYPQMAEGLSRLFAGLVTVSFPSLAEDLLAGVYVRAAAAEKIGSEPVPARDLLAFVKENQETNALLAAFLDDGTREMLSEASAELENAETLFVGENYYRALLHVSLTAESEGVYDFIADLNVLTEETFGQESGVTGTLTSAYDLKQAFGRDQILISVFTVLSIFLIVLLVFRSLSIPLLLVVIIQGAIWIFLSVFALAKVPIFFMSYIVASCILMGATIDYGILLSSHYVALRASSDRLTALSEAIRTALPTVISSGSVLMCCGFAVYIISDQLSVSTVGLLLGIGTLTSVVMVLFVLPSLLYLLDRFVMKTTWSGRKLGRRSASAPDGDV